MKETSILFRGNICFADRFRLFCREKNASFSLSLAAKALKLDTFVSDFLFL
jgi:hypothetical protein